MQQPETKWEFHRRGSSTWVVANCDRCKNGITIDLGEVWQKAVDVILSYGGKPCPPETKAALLNPKTIKFRHCGIEEAIPEKILSGELVVITHRPLASGKVQFI